MPGRFVHECALRWSDMDAYGHVNNARFLTLYEEARVAMMFVEGRVQGRPLFTAGVVVARHEIEYLRPVTYDTKAADRAPATVRIELWPEDVRSASFAIRYELFDRGALANRARSVLVAYDLAAERARRLSADERAYLTAAAGGGGPA
ncbi:acyl-CoA thioesterase [Pilimelia anulata]|uniref:acyl-CoA thioesterase n=1 Tax=Pilimelia anulata TaxID=53371 RepID=UPI00166357FD|nr:thioesterase family protein [Pilimelia anulata]